MTNFGTVQHAGKTLNLTQNAFLDCDGSSTGQRYYSAAAIDSDGNEYKMPKARSVFLPAFRGH